MYNPEYTEKQRTAQFTWNSMRGALYVNKADFLRKGYWRARGDRPHQAPVHTKASLCERKKRRESRGDGVRFQRSTLEP